MSLFINSRAALHGTSTLDKTSQKGSTLKNHPSPGRNASPMGLAGDDYQSLKKFQTVNRTLNQKSSIML